MNEKQLERKCCQWAESQGWLALKLVSPNNRGVPDRMFLLNGKTVFVEFKKPGGKIRSEQRRWIEKLLARNFEAHIIDRFDDFCAIMNWSRNADA